MLHVVNGYYNIVGIRHHKLSVNQGSSWLMRPLAISTVGTLIKTKMFKGEQHNKESVNSKF